MRWQKIAKGQWKEFQSSPYDHWCNCTGTVIFSGMADPFCWSYGSNSSQNQKLSAVYVMLVFIVPVYLLLYQAFTLYTPMRMQGRRLVLANIVKANSLGLLILMFTFYMIDESDFSRSTYIMFYVINIVLQWCARMLIFALLRDMRAIFPVLLILCFM